MRKEQTHWILTYEAMASPCEILIRETSMSEAEELASLALTETHRLEHTYSRYRNDNIVHEINTSDGQPVEVDAEMARVLDYADHCYRLSDGLFDITSGVLRQAWRFDGSEFTPDLALVESLRDIVGWDKVVWDGQRLRLQPEMEVDFGGIIKEYAVDRVAELLWAEARRSVMVNFGGDIRSILDEADTQPWIVGIENPGESRSAIGKIDLTNGGVATSGDLNRFCIVDGVRLGHILNPRTGWPVADAPRNVTVLADYCVEAGLLSTLAILQGPEAEVFLEAQNAQGHCIR